MSVSGPSNDAPARPGSIFRLVGHSRWFQAGVLVVAVASTGQVLWRFAGPFPTRAPEAPRQFSAATAPDAAPAGVSAGEARPRGPDPERDSDSPQLSSSPGRVIALVETGDEPFTSRESTESPGVSGVEVETRAQSSDPDREAPGLSISGAVLDDRGHLLPGIPVAARRADATDESQAGSVGESVRVTDANGMFTFGDLEEGEYDLSVEGVEGYEPAHARVRAGVGSADLWLQRLRSIRVRGTVSDGRSALLENVRVRALGDGPTVVTDASGFYEIPVDLVKAEQPPVLSFTRSGFRERRERIAAALGSDVDSVRLDVVLEPSELAVALFGRVTGPRQEPVPGVEVWLSSPDPRDFQRTSSGEQGEYRFAEVEIGNAYRAGVEPGEDYEPFLSEPFAVGPDDTMRDISLEPAGSGWLTGEVVDPEGAPLRGFALWIRRDGTGGGNAVPIRTDGTGRFEVEHAPAGSLKIQSQSEPLLQATGIQLLAGETRHLVVPLDWGPHWLFGQIVDAEGTPVSRARIIMQWSRQYADVFSTSRREAFSDRAGYFTFSSVGAGDHVMTVEASGFETARLVLDPRSSAGEMRFALTPRGVTGQRGSGG